MTLIVADDLYMKHLTGPFHPECPARYQVIKQALTEANLMQNTLKPRRALKEEILLCHTPEYYQIVEQDVPTRNVLSTGDVTLCPASLDIALLSAGGVLTAVDAVMEGKSKTAFCLIRPPGHHATTSQGMGFCIFNNVAIGARYVQKKYGIKRVLIVDWDVHHGNGTQEIFEKDPTVFYFSTHEWGIYPGTGRTDEKGAGTLCNCPINPTSHADQDIQKAFETVLVPAMEKFKPEFVFISCGFDALSTDLLGHLNLTPESFATLTGIVQGIADRYAQGKLVSCLEGGYDLNGIGAAAVAHVKALNLKK